MYLLPLVGGWKILLAPHTPHTNMRGSVSAAATSRVHNFHPMRQALHASVPPPRVLAIPWGHSEDPTSKDPAK